VGRGSPRARRVSGPASRPAPRSASTEPRSANLDRAQDGAACEPGPALHGGAPGPGPRCGGQQAFMRICRRSWGRAHRNPGSWCSRWSWRRTPPLPPKLPSAPPAFAPRQLPTHLVADQRVLEKHREPVRIRAHDESKAKVGQILDTARNLGSDERTYGPVLLASRQIRGPLGFPTGRTRNQGQPVGVALIFWRVADLRRHWMILARLRGIAAERDGPGVQSRCHLPPNSGGSQIDHPEPTDQRRYSSRLVAHSRSRAKMNMCSIRVTALFRRPSRRRPAL
jgi:hypothetical protein